LPTWLAQANEMQKQLGSLNESCRQQAKIKDLCTIETNTTFIKGEEKSKTKISVITQLTESLIKWQPVVVPRCENQGWYTWKAAANKKKKWQTILMHQKKFNLSTAGREKLQKIYGAGKTSIHA
jgi:hypothetical protein